MDVEFTRETGFQGRNGFFRCTGLNVDRYGIYTETIRICPITSKGLQGNCSIEIPVEDIPELIAILSKKMREQYLSLIESSKSAV